MSKLFLKFIFLFYSIVSTSVFAQVSSTTSDFKVATAYSVHDSIFIFNQKPAIKKGTLNATTPLAEPATFEWSSYDTVNHVFLPVFKTDANVVSSVATNLEAGGYKIHVTKPGLDTTMIAWVFLNDFTMTVEKNKAGEVYFYRRTCEYINLQAAAVPAIFKYFNPVSGMRLILNNSIIFTWIANPANGISLGEGAKIWIEEDVLPNEDTEYTGRATDKFNLWKEDKVKYISIIPKADFEVSYNKKYVDSITSSPIRVVFTNNSKNAVKYTWIFGDGDTIYQEEPINTPEPHYYYQADKEYLIKLIASSQEGCIREDTTSIKVDKSELDVPNVFSPNDDGANDYFIIRNVSMREFHLTIFTRSGRKIYEFHGPDINSWEGWDGKINGEYAYPGIYYYVVDAISWERPAKKYTPGKSNNYSGFFYLLREKK